MQRRAGVGPVALEPPARRVDAEREQPFERGQAPGGGHVQVRERAAPGGGRLPHRDRLVERSERDRRPRHAVLVDEPRRGDRPVRVRLARGQHDAVPRAAEHHAEQPALVLQAGAVALGLRDRPLERREVEHRLGPGQAREVPLDGAGDDDRVELGARRAVRGEDPHGVRRRGSDAAKPGPCSPASSAPTNASWTGRATRRPRRPRRRAPTTASSSRRAPDERSASATSRAEYGSSCHRMRNASSTDRSATVVARASTSRTVSTSEASACVRPSMCSSAVATVPSIACAARISPRAAAGESRTRSDVRTDSTSCSRASASARQPPERQDVRERRGLGRERQAALGERAGHAGVVERAQQRSDVRALPPHDDGELVPRDALLHVEPAELARDRGVLLGRVRRGPRLDGHAAVRAMRCLQLDDLRAAEPLGEPADRDVGRPLEREDVRVGVAGHDEVGRRESGHDRLGGERGVLVVVDEQVVEQRLAVRRHLRRALQQRREVDDVPPVDHVLVVAVEPRELVPPAQSGLLRALEDVVGREERLLRPREELADLVGEPAHAQHVSVRRPLLRVLLAQELLHLRELVAGRQQIGRLRVVEPTEARVQDVTGQAVDRHHAELGQRSLEAREQRLARLVARASRTRRRTRPARGRRRPPGAARTARAGPRSCRCPARRSPSTAPARCARTRACCGSGERGDVINEDATAR